MATLGLPKTKVHDVIFLSMVSLTNSYQVI